MKRKIKLRRGSQEYNAVVEGGITIMEKQNKQEREGGRYVYIIHPMENVQLIGSLNFDFYDSFDGENTRVALFEDVFRLELIIKEIAQEPGKSAMMAMPFFIKLGRYIACESDVIIEVDNSSTIYQAYIANVSNIQIAKIIPGQLQSKLIQ